MKRWLVYVETRTIYGALAAAMYGFGAEPYREWLYYRWCWSARASVWFTNNVPPLGIPAIQSARLLGRVIIRHA